MIDSYNIQICKGKDDILLLTQVCHKVHVEYEVEVERVLSKEEFLDSGRQEDQPSTLSTEYTGNSN